MTTAPLGRRSAADLLQDGMLHHREGRLAEAERCYRDLLKREPAHAEGLHLLGILAGQAGQFRAALDLLRQAVAQAPDNADLQNNLGEALRQMRRYAEAREAYRRAATLNPDLSQVYENAASAAIAAARSADKAQRRDRARALRRSAAEDYVKLGQSRYRKMLVSQAEAAFRQALELDPRNTDAMNDLGIVLQITGRLGEAETMLKRALEIDPGRMGTLTNLANVHGERGEPAAAEECYRRALALAPSSERAAADLRHGRLYRMMFRTELSREAIFEEHRSWGAQQMARLRAQGRERAPAFANRPDPDRRLRIGFVSPDFRKHSVSYFLEPLLAALDRGAFESFCFAEVTVVDDTTRRLQELAARWKFTTGMADAELQRQIRADGVDVLVELAGHTANSRLTAFAPKPAPVTLAWLGYPGSTGLPGIDYRITDAIADPPGEAESVHTEALLRLEHGFLCYAPPAQAPPVAPAPCAAQGQITFGSFNNLSKVNAGVVVLWAELLRAVPDARLLIKATQLADPGVRARLLQLFAGSEVAAERILFSERIASMEEHLALYGETDIALDPFPYNGTATTCEALWMGVPVVTLRSDRHSGRVGASLLTRIGLEELIAETPKDYVARAVALARDADRLARLRGGLRERLRASPLCDRAGFARDFGAAVREVWQRWCAKAPD